MDYSFSNLEELNNFLNTSDISVPFRSKGRKTVHTEKYSLINFLSKFKKDIFIHFPTKLVHLDKPDFRILTESFSIGVEVTEVIPEQLAKASFLLEVNFPNGHLEPEFFGWDAPIRSNDEILEILKKSNKNLISNGFSGKSIEENWMRGTYNCILSKTSKLNKNNFEKFQMNWLLIYDNQTRDLLDQNYLKSHFPLIINDYFVPKNDYLFDRIFIESGNYFYYIKSDEKPLMKVLQKNVG
jgi:hypothetical protein